MLSHITARSGILALAVVACLLLAPAAAAANDVTVNGAIGNETDTIEGTVDDTNETIDNTTDTVEETVNDTTDTIDNTTDDVAGTVDDTAESVEGTVDDANETVGDTTESVGERNEEAVDDVTGSSDGGSGLGSLPDQPPSVGIAGTASLSTAETGGDLELFDSPDGADGRDDDPVAEQPELRTGEPRTDAGDGSGTDGSDDGTGPIPGVPPGDALGGVGLVGLAAAVTLRQGSATPLGAAANVARAAATPAIVAGSDLLDKLLRTFYPLRYSRFDESDPLEHEARREMMDTIESTPGTYLSEMSERAGIPLSTARHHVRILEREGLVASAKVRGRRRFYPDKAEGVELAAAMNDEATASLLDALARVGPVSVSGLADELGRDPSTVTHHLKRLEEDGIVVRERDGRAIHNRLAPDAAEALEPGVETEGRQEQPISAD